ncbi:tyrosyl-tRNA synthetase [Knufia obscura]|uniref:Tyrosine--tRNA ligase n=1 Tax=Knufia obscura TaxID=1635080 RepID=A0ABR0RSJ8_9EURO|nr:tyrosyl-tRNA synthetase [Knufia obscura]
MSKAQHLSKAIRRRPLICSDCRRWLLETSAQHQRRTITHNHIRKIQIAEQEWKERKDAIAAGQAKSILDKLEERGLVNQVVGTREALNRALVESRVGVYCGVDPTAASLHVGHLVPFMALGWMYIHGYSSTFLLGGFTASIGDPTDRLQAREEKSKKERKENALTMFEQLKRLSNNIEKYADRKGYHREWAWRRSVKNNTEWWQKVTVGEFLKRLGKYVRIGPMLGRDSVKNRMQNGDGMSYAEFTYPLIQGWDWWHLFQSGTQLQIGGADQYGNILAGADAVKAMIQDDTAFQLKYKADRQGINASGDPMGFTVPLLTTASGEKFGKSAGNAVWLDPQLMSSFDLYQFFLRSSDADVEKYMKLLTFMSMEEIHETMNEHRLDESKRVAQHKLASEFVELAHGLPSAQRAEAEHRRTFSNSLTVEDIKAQTREMDTSKSDTRPDDFHPSLNKRAQPLTQDASYDLKLQLPRSVVWQQPMSRILWSAGLAASRSEAQRLINNKGVYIAGQVGKDSEYVPVEGQISYVPVKDPKWSATEPLIIDGELLILRTGKWKKKFIRIVSDDDYEASGLTCPGWKDETESPADPVVKADLAGEEKYRKEGQEKARSSDQKRHAYQKKLNKGFGAVTGARMGQRKDTQQR